MTPQLTISIVLFVLAGGLTIWANTKLRKASKIANEANVKCESVKEEIQELNKRNRSLSNHVDFLQNQTTFGNTRPLRYGMVKTNSFFDVFAVYEAINHNHEVRVLIKRFEFGDDRDFALLEAQELLDHLNEK